MRAHPLPYASALLLLAFAPVAGAVCPTDPELAEEAPDVVLSPSIRAAAADHGFDAVRIFEFLRNEFDYQPYYGLMRGPEATLRRQRGNEYDIAALFVSLLRVSEDLDGDCELDAGEDLDGDGVLDGATPARFVRGRIRVPTAKAAAWIGAEEGGPTRTLLEKTEPHAWRNTAGIGVALDGAVLEKLHIWVEAEIPIARYRGSGQGEAGRAWIALDPSFKLREGQSGIDLPIGEGQALAFNFDDYYDEVKQELPLEIFTGQIRQYLVDTQPGKSLVDVPKWRGIQPVAPGVLPTALPYEIDADLTPVRSASLVPLHEAPPGGMSPDAVAGANGAADFRWMWEIKTCAATGAIGACGTVHATETHPAASLEGKRVLLTYPPVTPSQVPEGYTSCLGIETQPTLSIDTTQTTLGSSQTLCAFEDIVVSTKFPLPQGEVAPGIETFPSAYRVVVGGTYAVALDTDSGSPAFTQTTADALIAALETYPLAIDEASGAAYIETDGTPGKGPSEEFLLADFAAQEALTGGLLHLAAVDYFQRLRTDYDTLFALTRNVGLHFPWTGLVESVPNVGVFLDAPFMVRPRDLVIDIRGIAVQPVPADTGAITFPPFPYVARLASVQASAREHAVWEDLADAEAISTAKILQVRNEENADDLSLASAGPVASIADCLHPEDLEDGCSNPPLRDTEFFNRDGRFDQLKCDDIDFITYCALKRAFTPSVSPKVEVCVTHPVTPPGFEPCRLDEDVFPDCAYLTAEVDVPDGFWLALKWDVEQCPAFPPFGTSSVEELRIPQFASFSYGSFSGWGFYLRGILGGVPAELYAINPTTPLQLGGGFWVDRQFLSDQGLVLDGLGNSVPLASVLSLDLLHPALYLVENPRRLNTDAVHSVQAADPVSVVTGNLNHIEVDLEVPGRGGFDLRLQRAYNSRLNYDGPLGHGWIHTFDQHLRVMDAEDLVVWVDEDGGETPFDRMPDGTLVAPGWAHETLVENPGGDFILTTKTGIVYHFHPENGESKARLERIVDRNGNEIVCTYDPTAPAELVTVTDTAGRKLVFTYDQGRLETIHTDWSTPPRGWVYTVDENGDLISVKNPREVVLGAAGRATEYTYDNDLQTPNLNHNLRKIIRPADRDGIGGGDVTMEFVYYASDAVYSQTNSLGETTTFTYNFFRRRTTVTQPDGTQEHYIFDRTGNVIRHQSGRGVVREFEYEAGTHNRIAEIDGLGFKSEAEYDDRGNLKRRIDRLQNDETWTFNEFSQPTSHVDRRGHRSDWRYDPDGNLEQEFVELDGTLHLFREHSYDTMGNRIETTLYPNTDGSQSRTTRFEFAPNGVDLVRRVDALGHAVRFEYDASSRPTARETTRSLSKPPHEKTIREELAYDELDRVVRAIDPVGTVVATTYDKNGNVSARLTYSPEPEADPLVAPSIPECIASDRCRVDDENSYDAADRLISRTDALGNTTDFAHDRRGRVVRTRTPLGHETTRTYDADGNVIRIVDPVGATTLREYDAENRVIKEIDALGRETVTSYDEEGRVTEVMAPGGVRAMQVQAYDAEGNPTHTLDAEDGLTVVEYDALGRRTKVVGPAPDVPETQFAYDLEGKLTKRIDPIGGETTLRYDTLGRLVETTDSLGRKDARAYDELGNLTATIDGAGKRIRFAYDVRGLLTRRWGVGIDDRYSYDDLGRRVLAENGEGAWRFEYDDLDRQVALQDPVFGVVRQTYDADGRVAQRVYPGDPTTRFEYTARGEVSTIRDPAVTAAGGTNWLFEYDALGRVVRQTDPFGVERAVDYRVDGFVDRVSIRIGGSLTEEWAYSNYDDLGNPGRIDSLGEGGAIQVAYDEQSRLIKVAYPPTSDFAACQVDCEEFTYDLAGNRKTHRVNGVLQKYVVDQASQLTKITDDEDATLISYQHDAAGRRIARNDGATTTYGYDALGRLESVTGEPGTHGIRYGPEGGRIGRTDPQSFFYYLPGWMKVRGTDVVRLLPNTTSDDVLAEITATNGVRTILPDASGNVSYVGVNGVQETDSHSQPTERRYEAFGHLRSGVSVVERSFAGLPREGLSGLLYVQARHYDPATGRFVQPDPLGVQADQLYAYAANNPIVFQDPTGLQAERGMPTLFSGSPCRLCPSARSQGGGLLAAAAVTAVLPVPGARPAAGIIALGAAAQGALVFGPQIVSGIGTVFQEGNGGETEVGEVEPRTTREGKPGVRIKRPDGSVLDITPDRVKEFEPEPRAKKGLRPRKFPNPIPGSKGRKRVPTAEELDLLEKLTGRR